MREPRDFGQFDDFELSDLYIAIDFVYSCTSTDAGLMGRGLVGLVLHKDQGCISKLTL
jgi:hypothetical protein